MYNYADRPPNAPTRACPVCGQERPVDWFVSEDGACWRRRNAVPKMKHAPEQPTIE